MTALRLLNLAVWVGLFLYMLPGAWAAARAIKARHGDPMRLAVAATALIIIGFTARSLWAPEHNGSLATLYVLCILDGLYIARLANAYGRGPVR